MCEVFGARCLPYFMFSADPSMMVNPFSNIIDWIICLSSMVHSSNNQSVFIIRSVRSLSVGMFLVSQSIVCIGDLSKILVDTLRRNNRTPSSPSAMPAKKPQLIIFICIVPAKTVLFSIANFLFATGGTRRFPLMDTKTTTRLSFPFFQSLKNPYSYSSQIHRAQTSNFQSNVTVKTKKQRTIYFIFQPIFFIFISILVYQRIRKIYEIRFKIFLNGKLQT